MGSPVGWLTEIPFNNSFLPFVGDFIMPYPGAPFAAEGDFQGLRDAIVAEESRGCLLPGHDLSRGFSPPPFGWRSSSSN
jgi:hypothetical protein